MRQEIEAISVEMMFYSVYGVIPRLYSLIVGDGGQIKSQQHSEKIIINNYYSLIF